MSESPNKNNKDIYINYGKNEKLMEACRTLREYAWIVDK